MRRNDDTGELAWYRCWTPRPAAIGDLVHVAGRRWTVEENFQAAKVHAGLDEHQVRRWDSWHRWTTLAMLAHAFLTILAVVMNDTEPADDIAGLIAITLGEARRLFTILARQPRPPSSTSWPGPADDDTNTAPAAPTTNDAKATSSQPTEPIYGGSYGRVTSGAARSAEVPGEEPD